MDEARTNPSTTDVLLESTPFGAKERYAWEACTIQLSLTLHPEDGHPKGRLVTLAAWTHGDAPMVRATRRDEMGGGWPVPIRELLAALRADLPARERLARERQSAETQRAAKDAAAEAKRKEEAAARRAVAKTAKQTPKASRGAAATKEPKPAVSEVAPASEQTGVAPAGAGPKEAGTTQASLFEQSGSGNQNAQNDEEVIDDGTGEV